MREESRQIGEHRYTVTMLPLAQWQDLRDAVWPTLMGLTPDIVDSGGDPGEDQYRDLIRSVSVLLPLQPDSYRAALRLLQTCAKVDGQQGYLSSVGEVWWAQQGYAELSEWVAFSLEVQLVPFLRGLPLASLHRLSKVRQSQSRSTSIGTSGGS